MISLDLVWPTVPPNGAAPNTSHAAGPGALAWKSAAPGTLPGSFVHPSGRDCAATGRHGRGILDGQQLRNRSRKGVLVGIALGFMYGVWIFLALGSIFVMAKAMQEPGDDNH